MNVRSIEIAPRAAAMGLHNRLGLYGSYFFGMTGIGFCLPFLPLYLKEDKGVTDQGIAALWVFSALAGLIQFPIGLWSDRVGARKPFLLIALTVLAAATLLLPETEPGGAGWILLGLAVVLFAENGACRATVESLAGAEATSLAGEGRVGKSLGALRFWRPVGVVATAIVGGFLADRYGVAWLLGPIAVLQGLAILFALLIREDVKEKPKASVKPSLSSIGALHLKDPAVWTFVVAMVLFHFANAPPGAYLGLFLKQDLGAPPVQLSYAFVVSMIVWLAAVRPVGWMADRFGRKPILLVGWSAMAIRLMLLAAAAQGWQVLLIQLLDGLAQGIFAVTAAAWVTDRLADVKRAGEAQVLVGSCLVLGSALGPALAGLIVGPLGYRGLFGVLAAVGVVATLIVAVLVPETNPRTSRRVEA